MRIVVHFILVLKVEEFVCSSVRGIKKRVEAAAEQELLFPKTLLRDRLRPTDRLRPD